MERRKTPALLWMAGWLAILPAAAAAQTLPREGGDLPGPMPLFPASNWWNLDISTAPVDSSSATFISFVGGSTRGLHADMGGSVDGDPVETYGIPYVVVSGTQPKVAVQFDVPEESDGVDHSTETSVPFYPIPVEAQTSAHWVEGGWPANQDFRDSSDRHLLIVDYDNKLLYELFNVFYDGATWHAYSGAFFDMNASNRRPDGWTSADAAGLAILPGLIRYDEAFSGDPIRHAFRVTVSATNSYVFPASHRACSACPASAPPLGARFRLKPGVDLSGFAPHIQRILQAMKTYGLIVADNGSNMFITGTYDPRWESEIDAINGAFGQIRASDFEVVQLGYQPATTVSVADTSIAEGSAGQSIAYFNVSLSVPSTQTVTVTYSTADGTALAGSDYVAKTATLTFLPGQTVETAIVKVNTDLLPEANETFAVSLTSASGATITDGQGVGTIVNDDPSGAASAVPQYRLFNNVTHEHLYTTDLNEYNVLGANGWLQEGQAYQMFTSTGSYGGTFVVPLFRLFHPQSQQHLWSTDANEAAVLGETPDYIYEGITGYILPVQVLGTVPLYRMFLDGLRVHLWTTDQNEYDFLGANGWVKEGAIGYVIP
jgi:hypothetical protein